MSLYRVFSNSKIEHRCPKNTKVFYTDSESPHRELKYYEKKTLVFLGQRPGRKTHRNMVYTFVTLSRTVLFHFLLSAGPLPYRFLILKLQAWKQPNRLCRFPFPCLTVILTVTKTDHYRFKEARKFLGLTASAFKLL